MKTTYTVTNTADATAIVISTSSEMDHLHDHYVDLQVTAAAGTVLIEVLGANNKWHDHTTTADPTADDIVSLSQGPSDMYRDCRVTFAGTAGANSLGVTLRKRL